MLTFPEIILAIQTLPTEPDILQRAMIHILSKGNPLHENLQPLQKLNFQIMDIPGEPVDKIQIITEATAIAAAIWTKDGSEANVMREVQELFLEYYAKHRARVIQLSGQGESFP